MPHYLKGVWCSWLKGSQNKDTYSRVIRETASKELKPSLAKFSLYWPILIASSHSSTLLKLEKSGVLRSSRGRCTLEWTHQNTSSRVRRWRIVQYNIAVFTALVINRNTDGLHHELYGWISKNYLARTFLPWRKWGGDLQAVRVADHFVQGVHDLTEFRPVVSVFLPTVQHQLM